MDGFDGQLRARQNNDEALLEHAFANISDAVFGSRTADRFKTDAEKVKNAIDEILVYYHVGTREVPEEIQDLDEQLEYLLRPHSIMRKNVTLEKGWYRDSIGALLGTRKSDGRVVALLPAGMFGYVYRDERTGKPVRVTARNQDQFDAQAIAFYKVFPLTRLNLPTLLRYIVQTISTSDYLMFALATLIVIFIGLLMPRLNNLLVGLVAQSASRKLLVSMAAFMVCVSVSSLMFGAVKSLLMARIKLRMNLSVQAATMARILALPASFFKEYSSGELSSRASQVGKLCDMLASALLSTGLTSVFSLIYIGQIFLYAPALVRPALAIVLITVLFSLFTALLQMKISKKTMEVAAKENGMGYALLKGIEKIRLSGAETRAFARWMQVYSDKVRLTYHPPFLVKFNTTIALLISLAGTILMYEMAFVSGVSVADYYAFNTAYGMVSGAFLSLASIALTLAGCGPTLEMVKPFFDAVPEASEDKQIVTGLDGGIELDNICFRYDENMPNVLDNLTLKVEPGQYVAIVGATGCGKSTLMRLMLGFEKPQKGAVYYDGRDLETLDTKSLRKRIGVVMQNGKLFQGNPSDIDRRYHGATLGKRPAQTAPQPEKAEYWGHFIQTVASGFGAWPDCICQEGAAFGGFRHARSISDEADLDDMVRALAQAGASLFIRDNSYLGFPAYQLFIPGMSEVDCMFDAPDYSELLAWTDFAREQRTLLTLPGADSAARRRLAGAVRRLEDTLLSDPLEPAKWFFSSYSLPQSAQNRFLFEAIVYASAECWTDAVRALNLYLADAGSESAPKRLLRAVGELWSMRGEGVPEGAARERLAGRYGEKVADRAMQYLEDELRALPNCADCASCPDSAACPYPRLIARQRFAQERMAATAICQEEMGALFDRCLQTGR